MYATVTLQFINSGTANIILLPFVASATLVPQCSEPSQLVARPTDLQLPMEVMTVVPTFGPITEFTTITSMVSTGLLTQVVPENPTTTPPLTVQYHFSVNLGISEVANLGFVTNGVAYFVLVSSV